MQRYANRPWLPNLNLHRSVTERSAGATGANDGGLHAWAERIESGSDDPERRHGPRFRRDAGA